MNKLFTPILFIVACSPYPEVDIEPATPGQCPYGGTSFRIKDGTFLACDGAPGEQGAKGDTGPQGQTGAQGLSGKDADDFQSILEKILPYEDGLVGLFCCNGDETICGSGSGFKFNSNYYLTASHVLEDMSSCMIWNGDGYLVGETTSIGSEQIQDYGWVTYSDNISPVPFIRDYRPTLGEPVVVIGHPGVYETISWENQHTFGHVTSISPEETFSSLSITNWPNAFITDAVAWHGNSGGAVFNKNGMIIGILVGAYNGAETNAGPDLSVVIPIP